MFAVENITCGTRRRLLAEASRARARGRTRRSIAIYRQILSVDPADVEVAARLGQLLAAAGQSFEAWNLFRGAGRHLLALRRNEQALAVFKEAARCLPFEFDCWRISAEIERQLGREEDAFQTLLEGRNHFRSRFDRAQAIALLELARAIGPWNHDVVSDLAGLYAQTDQGPQALGLLESLALHSEGRALREVRWSQWQISLSLHSLREWTRVAWAHLLGREVAREAPVFTERGASVRAR